jgi:predicted ester cyclase
MNEKLELTHKALNAWNRRDLTEYSQLYHPGVKFHGLAPTTLDLAGALEGYRAFFAGFPDMALEVDDSILEGDHLALRFHVNATHTGEFQSIPPTGREINVSGLTILQFHDGKVVERWNQFNQIGMMQQLGVIP